MEAALTVKCSDRDPDHGYRDFCWTCAPYWDAFPICPTCKAKLTTGTKGKVFSCPVCKKRYRWDGGRV